MLDSKKIEIFVPEFVFFSFEHFDDSSKLLQIQKKYGKEIFFSTLMLINNTNIEDFSSLINNLYCVFDETAKKKLILGKSAINFKGKIIHYIVTIEEFENIRDKYIYSIKTKEKYLKEDSLKTIFKELYEYILHKFHSK